MNRTLTIALLGGLGLAAGCAGRPSLVPNSDPNLRRTSAQFAADAARRHPYKADAPRGGAAMGRAEYNLLMGTLQVLNYSDEGWDNVEIWGNRKYVCWLPKVERASSASRRSISRCFTTTPAITSGPTAVRRRLSRSSCTRMVRCTRLIPTFRIGRRPLLQPSN